MELQIRIDAAKRNISKLVDLRNQLMRSRGGGVADLGNQTQFGQVQGGPYYHSKAIINLGNNGEPVV